MRARARKTSALIELASVEALKRMAEAGVGVAVVPRIAVEREAAEGRLRALELDAAGNRLAYRLLWHRDKLPAPGVALFREVISG